MILVLGFRVTAFKVQRMNRLNIFGDPKKTLPKPANKMIWRIPKNLQINPDTKTAGIVTENTVAKRLARNNRISCIVGKKTFHGFLLIDENGKCNTFEYF
jgi:hypothetical protein